MSKSILICHPGRCGSHWLLNMLMELTGLETLREEPETIPSEGIILGTRVQRTDIAELQRRIDVIFLLRDPRDVETSMRLYDHIVPGHFTQEADAILENLGWFRWYLEQQDQPHVHFEELWLSPISALLRVKRMLGKEWTYRSLDEVVQAESFEHVAGRKRGEEDVTQHLRKGIIGDWKNHWDMDKYTRFVSRFGKEMRILGY